MAVGSFGSCITAFVVIMTYPSPDNYLCTLPGPNQVLVLYCGNMEQQRIQRIRFGSLSHFQAPPPWPLRYKQP